MNDFQTGQVTESASLARGQRKLFRIILGLLVMAVLEGMSYIGVKLLDRKAHLSSLLPAISDKVWAADVYQNIRLSPLYDAEIGSDMPMAVRNDLPITNTPLVSVYGDSFTFAQFVETRYTWPYVLGEKAGVAPVLNMGKPGYGLDQTLLKLRKYYDKYPSKVVIAGLVPLTIQRVLAQFVNYYYGEPDPVPMTKPRYRVVNGNVEFVPNLCGSYENMLKLLDADYLRECSRRDYWYCHDIRCFGYDRLALKPRSSPYILEAANIIRLRLLYPRSGRNELAPMYEDWNGEGMVIMRYLADQFAEFAAEKQFTLVIVVNCAPGDFESNKYMGKYLDYIRGKGIIAVNIADIFNREIAAGRATRKSLFGTSHYSELGNRIAAEGLAPLVVLLKDGKLDEARRYADSLRIRE